MISRFVLPFLFCGLLLPQRADAETIGLRFVVDNALGATENQRRDLVRKLESDVDALNGYYRESLVKLSAAIVQIEFAPVQTRDALEILKNMAHENSGFAELFAKADEFGADYTIAIVDKLRLRGKPICGRALAVNKTLEEIADVRRSLAVIDRRCQAQTLAHELGHLMGLNHGDKVDECDPGKGHRTALTPYAKGFAEGECNGQAGAGKFGTIMVGGWMKAINGDGHSNLPIFSNPLIRDPRCGLKGICGDTESGDAARALNEHAKYYVRRRGPDLHGE